MQKDIWSFLFNDGVVYPDFILRNEFVHIVVATLSEINIKSAADQPSVDYPY
jgi:hypothetical protein